MASVHSVITVICLSASVFYSGCASYSTQHIQDTEQRLLSAGFLAHGPDTAERRDLLETLPAHQIVNRQIEGTNYWIYADPTIQKCLYIGNDEANSTFKELLNNQSASYDERYTPQERFNADILSGTNANP